jgi:putative membrane protein
MQHLRLRMALMAALAATVASVIPTAGAQAQTMHPIPAVTLATAHSAAPLDDPTIVAIFDSANSWDIELGRLALGKSHNKEVRTFADMMVRDHTAARQLGRDLAAKLHVTPTPPGKDFALYKDHVAILKTLNAASGARFDKAYVDHEAWYHQAVIDAVTQTLLPATKNDELRDLEVKVAPNFQAHLAAAKDLQQKLGVK